MQTLTLYTSTRAAFAFCKVLVHFVPACAYKMLHRETEPEALRNLSFFDLALFLYCVKIIFS